MPIPKKDGLTLRQERFVNEYMIDGNATRAATAAGYSPKTAHSIGHENLSKPEIKTRIEALRTKAADRYAITADRVLRELALLSYSNMADYMGIASDGTPFTDLSALTRDQSAAITELTVEEFMDGGGEDARPVRRIKVKLADKKGALVELGKHLKLFDGDAKPSAPIIINIHGSDKGLL